MLQHYVKSVRIRSCSGSHFPAFGLNKNAGKYGPEKLRIRTLSRSNSFVLVNHLIPGVSLKGHAYLTILTGENYRNNSIQQEFVKNRILTASDYCLHN